MGERGLNVRRHTSEASNDRSGGRRVTTLNFNGKLLIRCRTQQDREMALKNPLPISTSPISRIVADDHTKKMTHREDPLRQVF